MSFRAWRALGSRGPPAERATRLPKAPQSRATAGRRGAGPRNRRPRPRAAIPAPLGRTRSPCGSAAAATPALSHAQLLCRLPNQSSQEEHAEGDRQQHDRDGARAARVLGLDLAEDVDRRRQRPAGDVAGHDDDRAELAERARKAEQRAGQDAGRIAGSDDAPERRPARSAQRPGGLLLASARPPEARAGRRARRRDSRRRGARARSRASRR